MDISNRGNSQVLFDHNRLLLDLICHEAIAQGRFSEAFKRITEALANGLLVERTSIWFFNENKSVLECKNLYERSKNQHSQGHELKATEFSEGNSLRLDVPIKKNGEIIGMVCSEAEGPTRKWSLTDQTFAELVAAIIMRVLDHAGSIKAQKDLELMNENLRRMVDLRTQQLEEQRTATVQAAKLSSLGELSASIAHEINSPLAAVQILSGQLIEIAKRGELDGPTLVRVAKNIENTITRIGKIIKSLRSMARDSAQDPYELVSLRALIDETLVLCNLRLKYSQIELKIQIQEDLKIECRPVEIQQVFLNLINNSIEAFQDNAEEKWIEISSQVKSDFVEISFTDNGSGIPDAIREKIMQPFFTTKEAGKGIGLGLSISMGIIQNHRGQLYLDNKCPNTRFVVSLPLRQNSKSQVC